MLEFEPPQDELHYFCHGVNDTGVAYASGIAGQIRNKWPIAYEKYRKWQNLRLGDIQLVKVSDNKIIVNLVSQKDYGGMKIGKYSLPNIRYDSVLEGYVRLKANIEAYPQVTNRVIHTCLIGVGLGGGTLYEFGAAINKVFKDYNGVVTVWAYAQEQFDKLRETFCKCPPFWRVALDTASPTV